MLANKSLSLVLGLVLAGAAGAQFVVGPPGAAKPWLRGLYVMTLTGTASGVDEPFLFYTPGTGSARRPLAVGFHSYGQSIGQFLPGAGAGDLILQAAQRDWYVVCPTGQTQTNMGVWHMQNNVEEVLAWVDDNYSINHARVYGMGFSMGGGWMMSYAERHLDPTRPMFAAVVNHTGGMSLTYAHALDPTGPGSTGELLNGMLGGPPTDPQFLFGYLRSQSIDLDLSLAMNQTNDMARNITHVKVVNFHAVGDPSLDLITSLYAFHTQLQDRINQAVGTLGAAGGSTSVYVGPGTVHHWSTLDIPAACTWLDTQTLTIPTASGSPGILCDRDGRWFNMDVALGSQNTFAAFRWGLSVGNTFDITFSSNLAGVLIHSADAGLLTTAGNPITLNLSTADSTSDTIKLDGFTASPLVSSTGAATSLYHDPSGTLWIFSQPGGAPETVTIVPQ